MLIKMTFFSCITTPRLLSEICNSLLVSLLKLLPNKCSRTYPNSDLLYKLQVSYKRLHIPEPSLGKTFVNDWLMSKKKRCWKEQKRRTENCNETETRPNAMGLQCKIWTVVEISSKWRSPIYWYSRSRDPLYHFQAPPLLKSEDAVATPTFYTPAFVLEFYSFLVKEKNREGKKRRINTGTESRMSWSEKKN